MKKLNQYLVGLFAQIGSAGRAGVAMFSGMVLLLAVQAEGALAAADPTTGIDYQADIASPIISSAKPAIVAGLAVLVLILAVTLGKKVWHKASGN